MELHRFAIDGRVIGADDVQLQDALARAYQSPSRPRCLCVPSGVEMYVARHRQYVIKRMPDAYFSDRGRLFQADRGRRIGVTVAAPGRCAGTGLNVAESSTISLKPAVAGRVSGSVLSPT